MKSVPISLAIRYVSNQQTPTCAKARKHGHKRASVQILETTQQINCNKWRYVSRVQAN